MCSTYSKANILKELKLRFMAERVFERRQVCAMVSAMYGMG